MPSPVQPEVYVSDAVRQVERLHPYVFTDDFHAMPIRRQLDLQAHSLVAACAAGNSAALFHIRSWFPAAAERSCQELMASGFPLSDARLTMAREHGYAAWSEVEALGDLTPDSDFERAVDAVVSGDLETLAEILDVRPDLVRAHSRYGHGATLLHYLGANGVETYRQRTPMNAAAVASFLIERGADVAAEAQVYGGGQTTLALLLTSAHPAEAGVTDAVADVLRGAP